MNHIDQTGYKITLARPPLRIISLVPSQTELLYYLDIRPVGQTIFCIHPSNEFKGSNKIGGTKKLRLQKIRDLQPDLIIGNKEENDQEQIEKLRSEYPVWLSDIYTMDNAVEMIKRIGEITHKEKKANLLAYQISNGFSKLASLSYGSVLYLIWYNPYMASGCHTFIHSVLKKIGFQNVLTHENTRYPELSVEQIVNLNPENIFLSSEPFPFGEHHILELQKRLPTCKIHLVNGELYSWYGPRLLETLKKYS